MVSGRPGPATTSGHLTQFFSVCVHTRDRRGHTDRQQLNSNYSGNSTDDNGGGGTAAAASSSAAAAVATTELRWCLLRLPAAPAALPLRCLCLLCLWLRLWGTAAAAPLPVENREEEAPRAHLRAGTQPAQGSNPGRAVRESSLMPAAGEENVAPRLESSAKMTGSRTTFASCG